jgi:hypothetical protein
MRVPLRLAATLLKMRFAEISGIAKSRPAMRYVSLPEGGAEESSVAAVPSNPDEAVPVYWVSGCGESLATPSVGKWVRRLQDAGRTVFLETDGTLLRRRIHEFCPDARLYMTIRLYGLRGSHDLCMRRNGAFALAIEGIRAAQLSGFLVCAHVPVRGETDLGEVKLLLQLLRQMDLDGVVVTPAYPELEADEALQKKVTEASILIGNAWWTAFSRLAERAMSAAADHVFRRAQPSPDARDKATLLLSAKVDLRSPQSDANISEEVALP